MGTTNYNCFIHNNFPNADIPTSSIRFPKNRDISMLYDRRRNAVLEHRDYREQTYLN